MKVNSEIPFVKVAVLMVYLAPDVEQNVLLQFRLNDMRVGMVDELLRVGHYVCMLEILGQF